MRHRVSGSSTRATARWRRAGVGASTARRAISSGSRIRPRNASAVWVAAAKHRVAEVAVEPRADLAENVGGDLAGDELLQRLPVVDALRRSEADPRVLVLDDDGSEDGQVPGAHPADRRQPHLGVPALPLRLQETEKSHGTNLGKGEESGPTVYPGGRRRVNPAELDTPPS